MSSNLPPSFKPIAHYIKIANENASRDPVIYYWSAMFNNNPTEFDYIKWTRLKERIRQDDTNTEQRDTLRDQLNTSGVKKQEEVQLKKVEIEEKEMKNEELRKQIAIIKERIRQINKDKENIEKYVKSKEDREDVFKKTIVNRIRLQKDQIREEIQKPRIEVDVMTRLVTHRKLFMIQEVMDLFNIKCGFSVASGDYLLKKSCACQIVDSIRGLHFPQTPFLFSHSEKETIGALEIFLQMLVAIHKILDYSPRYPIDLKEMSVSNLLVDRKMVMTTCTFKKNKEEFRLGMQLIGKDIGLLREACGIPVMTTDRILFMLMEWHQLMVRKKLTILDVPVCSVSSPASLLINMNE